MTKRQGRRQRQSRKKTTKALKMPETTAAADKTAATAEEPTAAGPGDGRGDTPGPRAMVVNEIERLQTAEENRIQATDDKPLSAIKIVRKNGQARVVVDLNKLNEVVRDS